MARLNINNIENVEGKYHVMFFEGKNMVENAKINIRNSFFLLLFFSLLVFLFIVISGFNLFFVGFLAIYLIFFVTVEIYYFRQKRIGRKQCIYAVENSHSSEIIAKQVDNRKATRAIVKSMSSTVDKYDAREKYPKFRQKIKRSRKHRHIVGVIMDFEKENKGKN